MIPSRVFTIPPGLSFLDALAEAVLDGRLVGTLGHDPFALSALTLYLPTRRAVGALEAAFARRLGGAALLPRMIPLGEADEAEFDLALGAMPEEAGPALRPPMPALQRRLILARLVQGWARTVDRGLLPLGEEVPFVVPSSPADAVGLAGDLERLMDALTVEDLPWDEMQGAVEAEHSRYFGLTLDFLKIAAEHWPGILAERALSDPAARASRLVRAEAERLDRERPDDPVIVAGSTGSIPSTARLIASVARLPRGAVVLPGLDHDLDADGWAAIGAGGDGTGEPAHGHPQAVLHALLGPGSLGLAREDVAVLGAPDADGRARQWLLSQALRPAETTDAWAGIAPEMRLATARAGLAGLAVVEARDEREEALVIALALRETLERPEATAALITPDRLLAERVAADLARWGVVAQDSAGTSLARAPAGRLARLAAELAAEIAPARVLALLAHPLVRLGLARGEVVRGAAALEIGALRGPAPREAGFAGLRATVLQARAAGGAGGGVGEGRVPRARARLKPIDWDLAEALVDRLEVAFADFVCEGDGACDLLALAGLHREACDRLLSGPEDEDEGLAADLAAGAGAGPPEPSLDGLDALFDDLDTAADESLPGRLGDYPAFFTALARERMLAQDPRRTHPRLRILGLLEARLLRVDRVVLGGLDEGVWPPRVTTDAFLNRPMRERVRLPPPERRIGQTAHDLVQALGTRDALITRAGKREGTPTVPSRFLQRLRAFAGETPWRETLAAGARWRGLAAALDGARPEAEPAPGRAPETKSAPGRRRSVRPAPRVDPALFPRRLSVTQIETLVRDPYAIFARHVLGLEPLEPVAGLPGAAERGTIVHAVVAGFARAYPQAIPDPEIARQRLADLAANAFGAIENDHPELYAEWFPRIERMNAGFLDWELARRPELARVHEEVSGRWSFPVGGETFTLTGRADRIETRRDGGACIVDFKTGAPPSNRTVAVGFSPQLTLEAGMLRAGAFDGLPAGRVPDLLYVHASGGRDPFRAIPVKPPPGDARDLSGIVDDHVARLKALLARYLTGEAAYVSRPHPHYPRADATYDHLARVLEWSLAGEEG